MRVGSPSTGWRLNKCHSCPFELVRTAGSPLLRHQPSDPGYIEAGPGLIVGQPRDPVFLGCMGHRRILDRHAAQHLVLDLPAIARVEELAVAKFWILDLFG